MIVLPIMGTFYLLSFTSLLTKLENQATPFPMDSLILLHTGIIVLGWILFFTYIVHLGKSNRVSSSEKLWWVLGFLILSPFSMIYYWLKYINPLIFKD